ncbi:MAG TPA: ROK family transcriptional regulator [Trebonia sp.]|jgi:predicted NBD/HSP70 family sugar kinase|nr:ROK family transcriptional regulator [Trebonia sp.]
MEGLAQPSVPQQPRPKPGTPSLLRELNDRAALELLLADGPLTRAQLSERTGVSKVTVSQMLARLEERGLVRVVGEQAGGRGPNAALYSVVPSSAYVAGLYVELDLVSAAVADVAGNRVANVSVDPSDVDDPVGMVRDAIGRACESAGIDLADLSAVVIGSPGVLDPRTGAPRLAVNLPTWHEGVLDGLRDALHTPVVIENDVNLAAMAERAPDGAAAGLDDFVLVWLGGGLGLATVIGGQVLRGTGGAAGEIGWMPVHGTLLPSGNEHPGKAGLQALAGGWAIQALAMEHGFGGGSASEAIAAAVADIARGSTAAGGSRGGEFLDEVAHRVAIGVAAVCVVLDPGLVVLGGPVGHAGADELAARVAAEVPRICLARPTVVPTTVHGEPVLRGAMQAALGQARARLLGSLGLEP